jgi:hypothetical protein
MLPLVLYYVELTDGRRMSWAKKLANSHGWSRSFRSKTLAVRYFFTDSPWNYLR